MILNMLLIPIHKILIRTPLINHPPIQLPNLLRTLSIARHRGIPIVLLLPLHQPVVHVVPPAGLSEALVHDLFAELGFEAVDFEDGFVAGGFGGGVLGLGGDEGGFGVGEVELGLLLVHLGFGEEVFDAGVVHVGIFGCVLLLLLLLLLVVGVML